MSVSFANIPGLDPFNHPLESDPTSNMESLDLNHIIPSDINSPIPNIAGTFASYSMYQLM
jgi:hypothetical protein